jgi:hypothetical protein
MKTRRQGENDAGPHPTFGHPLPEGEGNCILSPSGREIERGRYVEELTTTPTTLALEGGFV